MKNLIDQFWEDYEKVIKPRLLSWINHNKKTIENVPKRLLDSDGFYQINDIRHAEINGKNYRCTLKVKIDKKLGVIYNRTAYLIVNNSVYVLPSEKLQNYVIRFTKEFFDKYSKISDCENLDFISIVDKFMKNENQDIILNFSEDTNESDKEFKVNSFIEFKNDLLGLAEYKKETKEVIISKLYTKSEIEKFKLWCNSKSNIPIEIYLEYKRKNKMPLYQIPITTDIDKQREINDAWELYEKGKFK